MKEIDIYKQYFAGECVFDEVERKGVVVMLTAISDSGMISYQVSISFFPHREEDDFAISYDAYGSKEIYKAKGRRSKKRETTLMDSFKENADELATQLGGSILWDKPLTAAYYK